MIVLDYKDRRPLYEQVVERFKELIIKGILPEDMQMPSVRNQAMQLSINPNTIQRAYSELELCHRHFPERDGRDGSRRGDAAYCRTEEWAK